MTVRVETDNQGLPLADWKRIDTICDRFEAAAREGQRPDLAGFLGDVKGPARERLFRELLALELDACLDRGERPDAQTYRDRFPDHVDAIDEAFVPIGLDGVTLQAGARRVRSSQSHETGGPKLSEFVPELPRAELNPVVLEALRLEGYEVKGELGRGGMGVVYLARKVALNRLCALKMVLAGAHAGSAAVARFRAEAEAVARLRHPDIVQIYHVGEADGLAYLELEYLPGGGLDQALDGSPWPATRAARLVEIIARAIAEAHRQGIIHRDLKPANILLDVSGRPKVADFGLAKILDSDDGLTKSRSVLGSPCYMAPEQAAGDTNLVGATTDVYALGAILYELLTGRPPFRAATPLETLAQVKDTEPVPPSRFQPGLRGDIETICLKCLEKSPGRRYATGEDLAEDLRRLLAGEPILAHPAPSWERVWKWARRRPALAGALFVSTAAVVLLLVGALYYNTQLRASVKQAKAAQKVAVDQRNVTLQTLNQLVFGVQERLGKTPATRQARKGLLDIAIEGLDEIAQSTEAGAPDLGRAVAHQKLGDIFRELGHTEEAHRQYKFSRQLAETLAASAPRDLATMDCLLRSFAGLGELSLQASRNGEAVEHLERVVELAERAAEINPDRAQVRSTLLEAYFRLGRAYSFNRDLDQGEIWFRKMHDLAERWDREEPGNVRTLDLLSTSYRKLADVRKLAGDNAAARIDYLKAIELDRSLLLADAENLDVKLHLALALDDLGTTLRRLGELDDAETHALQAETLFVELVRADPEDIDNRVRLVQTQYNCGGLEMDLLRLPAAAVHLRRALDGLVELDRQGKLDGRPRDRDQLLPAFQSELIACERVAASPGDLDALKARPARQAARLLRIRVGVLVAEGRFGELEPTAGALVALEADQPEDLYELGRSLEWCAGYLAADTGTEHRPQELEALKRRFDDRAVTILVRAVDRGLRNVQRLTVDVVLAPIRQHPGFRQLSERLAASTAPAKP
jgi:eukaryotic-like serine/threonine-protein kinase